MRPITRSIIAAAALLAPAFAYTAYAEDGVSYPRVVGSGENATVEYGPDGGGTIVGGGAARVIGSGENASLEYHGPVQSQPSLFAYAIGSGENTQIIYSTSPDRSTALAEAGVFPFTSARTTALAALPRTNG